MVSITIIGTGYVGLVSGTCLADFGNKVTCIDTDLEKIKQLKTGKIPIFEPGLADIVRRNTESGRLEFSDDFAESVKKADAIFIAVGTPSADDGSADLSFVENAVRGIGRTITGYKIVVDKSTVPIGTGKKVKQWINEEIERRIAAGTLESGSVDFDIVSNPEFLREGAAVYDFMHPDRIVIGAETERSLKIMKDVYKVLYLNETPFIETNIETAEMIKYAANAFLAVKISYINEIANLCEKVGANIQGVIKALGRDKRIGDKFLHPGPGYGGSCFPKDTHALAQVGRINQSNVSIVEAAIKANENQRAKAIQKIETELRGVLNKKIAVLGVSFKPMTNDIRESPGIFIIEGLLKKGAIVSVSDPVAIPEAKIYFSDMENTVLFFENEYDAIKGANAVVIVTEWNQYRSLDLDRVKSLLFEHNFFDLRNLYKRNDLEQRGFKYFATGQ
jgi:UDPglucose 6-dehydrogenase